MRAWLSRSAGGPETLTLEEVPDPAPRPGHAIVDVKACGMNFPDLLLIAGKYQFAPERPFSPGGEIGGIVASVGAGVSHVAPGDRVLGNPGWGGMAERASVAAHSLVPIPDGMAFAEAAAFITTYGTSYHALKERAMLAAGETVLILGASGGVGVAALDLALAMGGRVIAACSTEEKLEFCLARGAHGGVLYGAEPQDGDGKRALANRIKDAVGANGADVIFDAVGGGYSEPALRAIAWNGRFLVVGFAAGTIPAIPLNLLLLKNCQAVGVFYGEWSARNPEAYREDARHLLRWYREGVVRPAIARCYPFVDGARALADLSSRTTMGKLVVTIP